MESIAEYNLCLNLKLYLPEREVCTVIINFSFKILCMNIMLMQSIVELICHVRLLF